MEHPETRKYLWTRSTVNDRTKTNSTAAWLTLLAKNIQSQRTGLLTVWLQPYSAHMTVNVHLGLDFFKENRSIVTFIHYNYLFSVLAVCVSVYHSGPD